MKQTALLGYGRQAGSTSSGLHSRLSVRATDDSSCSLITALCPAGESNTSPWVWEAGGQYFFWLAFQTVGARY